MNKQANKRPGFYCSLITITRLSLKIPHLQTASQIEPCKNTKLLWESPTCHYSARKQTAYRRWLQILLHI